MLNVSHYNLKGNLIFYTDKKEFKAKNNFKFVMKIKVSLLYSE